MPLGLVSSPWSLHLSSSVIQNQAAFRGGLDRLFTSCFFFSAASAEVPPKAGGNKPCPGEHHLSQLASFLRDSLKWNFSQMDFLLSIKILKHMLSKIMPFCGTHFFLGSISFWRFYYTYMFFLEFYTSPSKYFLLMSSVLLGQKKYSCISWQLGVTIIIQASAHCGPQAKSG